MNSLLKFIIISIILSIPMQVFALEFDLSVDDEIRKIYNPSELELKTLPKLPNMDKTTVPKKTETNKTPATTAKEQAVPTTQLAPIQSSGSKKVQNFPNSTTSKVSANDNSTAIKLKKGTKFKVQSLTNISDSNRAGARMSFKTLEPVTQRYITIPSGTVIKAVLTETHPPQKTGNGGLIVIKIDSLSYNGSQKSLNGKVTRANSKKIFLNNIKGKRKYISNIPTYAKKGKPFYRKMMNTTSKLSQNPVGWILTPFTVISGVAVYGTTIIVSPISAGFSKGGHISIPSGSSFELKLQDDAYME